MKKVVLSCLGAGHFGGGFREGLGVFLGSGRRVRELGTWSLQVCKPNLLWIQNLSLFVPPKFAGFQGQGERAWVLVLGFRPQGKVVMEVVGSGECWEVKVAVR